MIPDIIFSSIQAILPKTETPQKKLLPKISPPFLYPYVHDKKISVTMLR